MSNVTSIFSKQQQAFLEVLAITPVEEHVAALKCSIPIATIREWMKNDPDFNLAVTESKELALDLIEASLFEKTLADGRLALDVLKARRPERWNPALKVEVDVIGHRYIDFAGKDVHAIEGEAEEVDGETEE